MKSFGGVSSQFLEFMRQGKQSHHLPSDDDLNALTHRAYPAIVDVINAFIAGKRRVQVFNCEHFLVSPCLDDYQRAVEKFKNLLAASFEALRELTGQKKIEWNCEDEILVRTSSTEDDLDVPVVTLARGQRKHGYDVCVTGLCPVEHPFVAFQAKRNKNLVVCDEVFRPERSQSLTLDGVILCALLTRARDGVALALVQNDEDGERVAHVAQACKWHVMRVLGKKEENTRLMERTLVVWNTQARGWLTFESARVSDACVLEKQTRVTRCFALLYDCDNRKWVSKALGQIVGPLDERKIALGVTFFR